MLEQWLRPQRALKAAQAKIERLEDMVLNLQIDNDALTDQIKIAHNACYNMLAQLHEYRSSNGAPLGPVRRG